MITRRGELLESFATAETLFDTRVADDPALLARLLTVHRGVMGIQSRYADPAGLDAFVRQLEQFPLVEFVEGGEF